MSSCASPFIVESLETRVLLSTYLVTSALDGPGSIAPTSPGQFRATTLRAAVAASNARAGADVIRFADSVRGTLVLKSALPAIQDSLIIAGPGATGLTIRRDGNAAAFSVFQVLAGRRVTIGGLTLAGGAGLNQRPGPGLAQLGDGGGVHNAGELVIANCRITGNAGVSGAGIWNTGKLTLLNSTLSDNRTDGGGGAALYNTGTAILANVAVTGNAMISEGGQAIFNDAGAYLTATNCTIAYNSATYRQAGAIENRGSAKLLNCTIANNYATYGDAGGLYNDQFATMTLVHCTVAGNVASHSGIGGIFNGGRLTAFNSIVAGNWTFTRYDDLEADLDGFGTTDATSAGNVFGVGGSGGLRNGVNANKVNVAFTALKLGALANNGGPTATFALLPGSAAINAGINSAATKAGLYSDQRGLARIASGGRADAGAFETPAVGGASVSGAVFNDRNRDGVRQSIEPLLPAWQVYVDQNRNGLWDAGERFSFTSSAGTYRVAGLSAGPTRVRLVRFDGWTQTVPAIGYWDIALQTNQQVAGRSFGVVYAS
jgi:hypothetical protein